jgi:hypothetical protein
MIKTVKVKIAVSVDHTGDWSSAGWKGANEKEMHNMHSYTIDGLHPGERRYWLEAELELPEGPTTVEPIITEAQR